MLGTRGCRLGLIHPEIYDMQVRAIVRAAIARARGGRRPAGRDHDPARRLRRGAASACATSCASICAEEIEAAGVTIEIPIGTMIELPRAALCADEIAEHADFFSFGTNDLTQTTLGLSRDDAEGKFLTAYVEEEIVAENPFATIDVAGVGELVRIGRRARALGAARA